jgi:hypothetical protein
MVDQVAGDLGQQLAAECSKAKEPRKSLSDRRKSSASNASARANPACCSVAAALTAAGKR